MPRRLTSTPRAGFPAWAAIMDSWGGKMLGTVQTVAEMAAQGLGLPGSAFTEVMHQGPHLLAPTGAESATLAVDQA